MKRIEALAPLSRDHHHTLILAQLLKKDAPVYKGLPTNAKEKKEYALAHFESHIKSHFESEELILQRVRNISSIVEKLCDEIIQEHQKIRALFLELKNAVDIVKTMDDLATLLKAHIRKEERILFPILQEKCTADELEKIHQLLH